MLLRQALSRTRPALARRARQITHREEGRKLPREMVAAMTADGDASSYYESMRSRVAAGATRAASSSAGATRSASSAAGDDYVALADECLDTILERADELSDERDDVEVELSSGVLTLKTPEGTWVLNKCPTGSSGSLHHSRAPAATSTSTGRGRTRGTAVLLLNY